MISTTLSKRCNRMLYLQPILQPATMLPFSHALVSTRYLRSKRYIRLLSSQPSGHHATSHYHQSYTVWIHTLYRPTCSTNHCFILSSVLDRSSSFVLLNTFFSRKAGSFLALWFSISAKRFPPSCLTLPTSVLGSYVTCCSCAASQL